jgi:hypothetical protein
MGEVDLERIQLRDEVNWTWMYHPGSGIIIILFIIISFIILLIFNLFRLKHRANSYEIIKNFVRDQFLNF